jgi:hypothetical protein
MFWAYLKTLIRRLSREPWYIRSWNVLLLQKKWFRMARKRAPLKTMGSFEDHALGTVEFDEEALYTWEFVEELAIRSFNHYDKQSPNDFDHVDKKDIVDWCRKVVDENTFDPRFLNIVKAEQFFQLEIDEDWADLGDGKKLYIRGTIDLITEPTPGLIEAIDWKTGKRMNWSIMKQKSFEDLRSDPQLLLYNLAISRLYPDKNVLFTIHYINHGGPYTIAFKKSDIQRVKDLLRDQLKRVQDCTLPVLKESGRARFCQYVCSYNKNMSEYNPNLTQCAFFHQETKRIGMDDVIRRYTRKGHSVDTYENPGE